MAIKNSITIDDINELRLVDGLPTEVNGKIVRYHIVKLREITVEDDREAVQLAERLIKMPDGEHKLLVSQDEYNLAMTMRYCARFESGGFEPIDQNILDLDLFAKLTPLDLQAIRERTLLIESLSQLRHGLITDTQFSEMQRRIMGDIGDDEDASQKKPEGQAEDARELDSESVPAPEQLS